METVTVCLCDAPGIINEYWLSSGEDTIYLVELTCTVGCDNDGTILELCV